MIYNVWWLDSGHDLFCFVLPGDVELLLLLNGCNGACWIQSELVHLDSELEKIIKTVTAHTYVRVNLKSAAWRKASHLSHCVLAFQTVSPHT
jgi:hypothetical protein